MKQIKVLLSILLMACSQPHENKRMMSKKSTNVESKERRAKEIQIHQKEKSLIEEDQKKNTDQPIYRVVGGSDISPLPKQEQEVQKVYFTIEQIQKEIQSLNRTVNQFFKDKAEQIKFINDNVKVVGEKIIPLQETIQESVKDEAQNIKIESDLHAEDNAEYNLKIAAAQAIYAELIKKLENREKLDKELIDSLICYIKEKKKKFDKYLKKQTKVNFRTKTLKLRIKRLDNQLEKLEYYKTNNTYDGYLSPESSDSESDESDWRK